MLALLLLSLPSPPTEQLGYRDFATITPLEAHSLHGQRGRFRVVVDSIELEGIGYWWSGATSTDEVVRMLRFDLPGQIDEGETVIIDGVFQVIRHPATVGDAGTRFPGFTEYRLIGCRRVE